MKWMAEESFSGLHVNFSFTDSQWTQLIVVCKQRREAKLRARLTESAGTGKWKFDYGHNYIVIKPFYRLKHRSHPSVGLVSPYARADGSPNVRIVCLRKEWEDVAPFTQTLEVLGILDEKNPSDIIKYREWLNTRPNPCLYTSGMPCSRGEITKMMGTIESSVSVSQHQGLKEWMASAEKWIVVKIRTFNVNRRIVARYLEKRDHPASEVGCSRLVRICHSNLRIRVGLHSRQNQKKVRLGLIGSGGCYYKLAQRSQLLTSHLTSSLTESILVRGGYAVQGNW